MPIQCKGFSACIRHFSRLVRSSRAAALILGSCPAGVPREKMSSDAVEVRKGVGWGYLPPIPPGVGAADRAALDPEAGALALLDPAGAVPTAAVLISQLIILQTRVGILGSQLDIFVTRVTILGTRVPIIARFSTASRSVRGFARSSITSSVYRLFETIFPKI